MAMEPQPLCPQGDPTLGDVREPPTGEERREEGDRGAAGPRDQLLPLPPPPPPPPEGKTGLCFSSLEASIEHLKKKAEEMIENINVSRQKDHVLMTNFRDSLKIKVWELADKLEERMYRIYDAHNHVIQGRLQELSLKLERIGQLEAELRQVCRSLETVYRDLCARPEAPVSEKQPQKEGAY
ncbi:synaptonemal complex central element protein 2 [Erinaceus europaeus]|uniref:Synaptonemal complex central element protein 2 n=1 Tax=Erinaceus europaeus TaxID=9365 RepID=A0ABM3WMM7_ERIEU|nr:synaptonemal complex central element protein 2 [Erinaceus europaeus]